MDEPIRRAAGEAARHLARIREQRVQGPARAVDIRRHLRAAYGFESPMSGAFVLDDIAAMLQRGTVHGTHPAYFGPCQPQVAPMAVASATLIAAYNPQRAVREHAVAAHEIEAHVLRVLGRKLGFARDELGAHFCVGGQQANMEAVVIALTHAFPALRDGGLRALHGDPVLYASEQAHHSLDKAAHAAGLGRHALRRVASDRNHRLDVAALRRAIADDRARGRLPFMVVGTAGTTSTGSIDPLPALAELCDAEALWFHCDAAWAASCVVSPTLRPLLAGIECAASVTWDAHKWLEVPLGTGMLFVRDREVLRAAFDTVSPYMPRHPGDEPEPFASSLAWSRPAAGVMLFATLAERSLPEMARRIEHTVQQGKRLRAKLGERGFGLLNETPLPVVCFTHPAVEDGRCSAGNVARAVNETGHAFITPVELTDGRRALRACLSHADCSERDLDVLVDALVAAVQAS